MKDSLKRSAVSTQTEFQFQAEPTTPDPKPPVNSADAQPIIVVRENLAEQTVMTRRKSHFTEYPSMYFSVLEYIYIRAACYIFLQTVFRIALDD